MVGHSNDPDDLTVNSLADRDMAYHHHDDNGNSPPYGNEEVQDEKEEDICSCSFPRENIQTFLTSNLNNNGGALPSKGGTTKSSVATSPYIVSLTTSRQHSNHHVLT